VCLFINIIHFLQKIVWPTHIQLYHFDQRIRCHVDFEMFAGSATMNATSRNRDFVSMLTDIVLNEETK